MNPILTNLQLVLSANSLKSNFQECVLERKVREGVVEIFFDSKAQKVTSCLNGKQLPNFSLPSNLNKIHDVKVLKSYLQDVCIRAIVGSDGMVRIELFQRGKGGMMQEGGPSSALVIPQQDLASIGNDPSGRALVAYLESHPNLQVQVTNLQKGYYHVDVQKTMRDLLQVSDLLRAAWSGAIGHPCASNIIGMTANYQELVKQSLVTSGVYAQNCVQAIKFHGAAVKLLQSNKVEPALKILSQCEKAADVMVQHTEGLVQLCSQLVQQSTESLKQATLDHSGSEAEKRKILKEIEEQEANKAEMEARKTQLRASIQEKKEEEERMMNRADSARTRSTIMGLVSTAVSAFSPVKWAKSIFSSKTSKAAESISSHFGSQLSEQNKEQSAIKRELNRINVRLENMQADDPEMENIRSRKLDLEDQLQASEAEVNELKEELKRQSQAAAQEGDQFAAREAELAQQRAELQKLEVDTLGSLAKSVEVSKHLRVGRDQIEKAITSLQVVIKVLGKIQTAFSNTKMFWEGVKANCAALKEREILRTYIESKLIDEALEEMYQSALQWMTLGCISKRACEAMEVSAQSIDKHMSDLPDSGEADAVLRSPLMDNLLLQITEEQRAITEN